MAKYGSLKIRTSIGLKKNKLTNPAFLKNLSEFKSILKSSKKIKKNKKYKLTLKDAMLFNALVADGYVLPKDIDYEELKKENLPPVELVNMVKNKEIGLVLLRIVELVGQDELSDLDISTTYFINQLLIDAGLKKLRNKILLLTLPVRV